MRVPLGRVRFLGGCAATFRQMASSTPASGPLVGVRVLDASVDGGRFATKILAELGADVVRVHASEHGPEMLHVDGGLADWWFDGGTALLPLNLDDADDRSTFLRLVAAADILLESEGPQRMAELGFGADRLGEANPSLVHVSLTPFGGDGPRSGWQSSDLVMAAVSGVLSVNGLPDEPVTMWGRQMDNIAGFYAAICALSGLRRARATGRGIYADLSQQQAAASCTEHLLMFWFHPEEMALFGAPNAARQASLHWIRAYEVVRCARGHCMVSPTAGGVPKLLEWMAERGHAPVLPEPVASGPDVARLVALMESLRRFGASMDATELFEGGQARHVPFGEVYTVPQVVACPQHLERGFFRTVPDLTAGAVAIPAGAGAPAGPADLRIPGPLVRFSATPCGPPLVPPAAPSSVEAVLARWAVSPVERDPTLVVADSLPAPGSSLPLAGLRIIDFTHVLAGPFATRVMADLGAHVVKVQTELRAVGTAANDFAYSGMWNRSKDSITLNMGAPGATEVLRSMVEQADVLIENFSAGVLDDWGASWADLHAWNPRLVYVSMQGAGVDGPWRDFVTFAPTVHALCGLTALTGPQGSLDCGTGVAINDHLSGLAAAVAVLSALEARDHSGEGQHIDLSQLEIGAYLVGPALLDWFANGREAKAAGNRDAFSDPVPNDVVRAGDGTWLAVTARDDADWTRLAEVLHAGPEFASVDVRRTRREEVGALLATWCANRPASDAVDALQAVNVPSGVVQGAEAMVTADPQLAHRQWIVSMESPIWGTQQTDRFPAILRDGDGEEIELSYRHSPYLGEHNFEVYEALLGLDASDVAEHMGAGLFM